jgi:AraC-like DNA-binding protein
MEPYRENVNMERLFPVRAWLNANNEHISVHPHWHDEIEILYIVEGEGTQQINDNIFNFIKGDIICIAGNDVHSTYTYGSCRNDILVIQFNVDFIMPVYALSPEKKMIEDFMNGMEMPAVIKADSEIGKEIFESLMEIFHEFESRKTGFEMFIRARIHELIGIAARNFDSRKRSSGNTYRMEKAREMLQKTFKLIDDKYQSEITLEQAAKTSNLSVSHFCRLFKKATGMTFKEYLTFYRVNRAAELFITARSITEIANHCGFESMSSFIRAFKHYRNATPSSYRSKV